MTPNKWEIWLVDMPFEEGIGSKTRPALVIDSRNGQLLAGKMTTHPPRSNYPYEYQMQDWKGAGLFCATTLRLSKFIALDAARFKKKLGTAQAVDQVNIRIMLASIKSAQK